MALLEIHKFDDPVLRQKAKPVKRVGAAIRKTLKDMSEAMYEAKGIGLAAPQVGLDRAMIVVDVGEGLLELVNPKIVSSEGSATAAEGCLSLPGMWGEVPRAEKVKVEALDANGHRTWIEGEGMLARALQHEIDHLYGILFIDKATSITIEEDEDGEDGAEGEEPETAEGQGATPKAAGGETRKGPEGEGQCE